METCRKTYPAVQDNPQPFRAKACGCSVGFCRAETLLDVLAREVMSGRNRPDLESAYRAKAADCCGGFRITKD